MRDDRIFIKGNKLGINAIINMDKFGNFDEMLDSLVEKLSRGKKFYKGATLTVTTDLKYINERQISKLKDVLFDEILIKDCIFAVSYTHLDVYKRQALENYDITIL